MNNINYQDILVDSQQLLTLGDGQLGTADKEGTFGCQGSKGNRCFTANTTPI
jgi:hypothetical protein